MCNDITEPNEIGRNVHGTLIHHPLNEATTIGQQAIERSQYCVPVILSKISDATIAPLTKVGRTDAIRDVSPPNVLQDFLRNRTKNVPDCRKGMFPPTASAHRSLRTIGNDTDFRNF